MDRAPDERVALALGQPRALRESTEREHPLTDRILNATVESNAVSTSASTRAGIGSPDRGVPQDLMQPSPQALHLGASPQCRERAQERLLDEVLRTSVRTETPRQRIKLPNGADELLRSRVV
jgi:hypothetical protein